MPSPAEEIRPDENRNLLDEVLLQTKNRLTGASLAAAGCLLLSGTIVFLLGFVLADHWIDGGVPAGLRVALLIFYVAGLAAGIALLIVMPLARRVSDLYAARLLERSGEGLYNSLVNALQLDAQQGLPGSTRAALVARAAADAVRLDVRRAVALHRLRQAAYALGTVFVLFCVYAVVAPKSVRSSVLRAFGVRLAAPTRTLIVGADPADGASVIVGRPVTFTAQLAGRMPAEASVHFSPDGGATILQGQRLSLVPAGGAARDRWQLWQGTKVGRDVQQTVHWRIVAGDASSAWRRLTVRPVPDVTGLRIVCTPPAYTGLDATASLPGRTCDVDTIVGAQVAVDAKANVPARDPMLVLTSGGADDETRLPMATDDADPTRIAGRFMVTQSGHYCLRFTDAGGEPNRDPIRHVIHARPDKPPVVAVSVPAGDVQVRPGDSLAIRGVADDDFGVARLAIAYKRGAEGGVISLPLPAAAATSAAGKPTSRPSRRAGVDVVIPVARFDAQPGDTIEWQLAAWDNREDLQGRPAPQQGLGPLRRIRVEAPDALAKADDPAKKDASARGDKSSDGHDAGNDQSPTSQEGHDLDGQQLAQVDGDKGLEQFIQEHQEELAKLRERLSKAKENGEAKDSQPGKPGADAAPNEPREAGTDQQAAGAAEAQRGREDNPNAEAGKQNGDAGRANAPQANPGEKAGPNARGADDRPANGASAERTKAAAQADAANAGNDALPSKGEQGADKAGQAGASEKADTQDRNATNGERAKGNQDVAEGGQAGDKPGDAAAADRKKDGEASGGRDGDSEPGGANGHDAPDRESAPGPAGQKVGETSRDLPKASGGDAQKGDGNGKGSQGGQGQKQAAEGKGSQPGASNGQAEDKGEGNGNGEGQAKAEGREEGEGKGQGQGEGQGEGQGKGEGKGRGQGEGEGEAQGEGQGQSEGQGEGRGEGKGEGQSQGQGQGGGEGEGEGRGQASAQADQPGPGGGSSDSASQGEGESTGGECKGSGQGQGEDAGQSDVNSQGGQGARPGHGGGSSGPDKIDTGPDNSVAPDKLLLPTAPKDRSTLDTIGDILPVVDALEQQLRNGQLDPKLMEELGWDEARADAFVREFRKAERKVREQTGAFTAPSGHYESTTRPGRTVQRGRPGTTEAAPLGARHIRASDRTNQLFEVGRQRIAEEYRDHLKAFYESVSAVSQPATRPVP